MRALFTTSFLAAALALTACSAGTDHETTAEAPAGESDALSVYGKKLVGAYQVETHGSFEIDELVLESNGTFFWHHAIECIKAPCPTDDAGKWIGYAPAKGETQGRIRLTSKTEVRQYGVVLDTDGSLELSRFGTTAKFDAIGTYCQTVDQCDGQPNLVMVKCAGGYHTEAVCDPTIHCSKTCAKDAAPPAKCVISGCSGEICADSGRVSSCIARPEYACYRTATCAHGADGTCGWTETPALDACLASKGACTFSDAKKRYVGHSTSECTLVRFTCDFAAGETYFSDACGCGCLAK